MPWGSDWGETPWGDGSAAPAPPAPPPVVIPSAVRPPPRGSGKDIWFDVADGEEADRIVTPARDWRLTEGDEALAQWVRRCMVTNPGEWATDPNYGCGARRYLFSIVTSASRAELAASVKVGLLRNPRIAKVDVTFIDWPDPGILRIGVVITLRAQPQRSLAITTEVT